MPTGIPKAKPPQLCTPSQVEKCLAHFKDQLLKQAREDRARHEAHLADVLTAIENLHKEIQRDLTDRRAEVNRRIEAIERDQVALKSRVAHLEQRA